MTGRDNTGNEKIATLARFLAESRETVILQVLESVLNPVWLTFTQSGGIWDRFDPDELSYPRFISSQDSRRNYWKFYREYWREALGVEPNRAHLAVAKWKS